MIKQEWMLFPRIAIAGGPKTGKTTLSKLFTDRPVIHTDDFMGVPWEKVPQEILREVQMKKTGGCDKIVIEGVQVGRALRKGLEVDLVLWLQRPLQVLSPGQHTMAKGCKSIFDDWVRSNPKIRIIYV